MDGSPLHLALREMQQALSSPRTLTGMAAAVVVLGISGPFDTLNQLDTPQRLLYWLVIVVLSYLGAKGAARFALASLAGRVTGVAPRIAVAMLASSVPSWLVVYGVTRVALGGADLDPLRLWFYCLVIGLAAVTMIVVTAQTTPVAAVEVAPAAPSIVERLPHPQRGRLLHLSVSDHYVDVVTDKGHGLLLMRLSDAMRETGAVAGLQTHRAWCVSTARSLSSCAMARACQSAAASCRRRGKPDCWFSRHNGKSGV